MRTIKKPAGAQRSREKKKPSGALGAPSSSSALSP